MCVGGGGWRASCESCCKTFKVSYLEPTSGRHRRDGSDAAGNVVKVDAERGREQLVRRREELQGGVGGRVRKEEREGGGGCVARGEAIFSL